MRNRTSKHLAQKVLSCALSAAMVVAFAPAVALANSTDGNAGDGQSSVSAVANNELPAPDSNGKISLTTTAEYTLNGSVEADIEISGDASVTIHLAGHTIKNKSSDTFTVKLGASLTIDGTGTVDNVTHGKADIYNNGTVILNGGKYTRSCEAGSKKDNSGGNSYYNILNHGSLTINEGVEVLSSGSFSSLVANGYYNYNKSSDERTGYVAGANQPAPSVTINGGSFSGGINTIKNDDGAKATITNGTFTNYTQAALQNHGTATVGGGTFDASSQYAIDNCGCDQTLDPGKLDITGGTFKGALYVRSQYSDVNISGGEFTGAISVSAGSLKISGGEFSVDPKDYVDTDVSVIHQVSGTYHVHSKTFSTTTSGYKAPTCTESGASGNDYCAIDGYFISGSTTIAATGHKAVEIPAVAPTCTQTGLTAGSKCSTCGYVLTAQETVPATGHSAVAVPAVAPTCTQTGLTEGSKCSTCGETLKAQETVAATGHSYTWTVTTPATTEAEGVSTGACSACGDTVTKSIPKLQATETATDSTGAKVDVTVDTSEAGTTADGTSYAGTVTYDASSAVTEETTAVEVPATVEVGGVTYAVTKIADDAFKDMAQVTEVTVPATVTEIGAGAFAGTASLTSVTLPEGVETVGAGAFEGSGVVSVSLPSTVTEVATGTFKDCTSLTAVEAPKAKTLGASALAGCTSLTAVEVPAVKTIEAKALAGCTSLKKVEAPKAATVAASAFKGCTSLKTVSVESAKTIGASALAGCSKLKTVTTGSKLATIGKSALSGTKVKTLVISSKKLTKASVKGALKGSSVATIKVSLPGASKKAVAKVIKAYKKAFAKKNCGKAVTVKKA